MRSEPVRAALPSRMALVATVVPQAKAVQPASSASRAMPRRLAIRSSPLKIPTAMSPGVVEGKRNLQAAGSDTPYTTSSGRGSVDSFYRCPV